MAVLNNCKKHYINLLLVALLALVGMKAVAGVRPSALDNSQTSRMNEDSTVGTHLAGGNDRRKPLIYNGNLASTETYPFGVIICSTLFPEADGEEMCTAICTGSIVSPGVIMTAAHCFNDYMDIYDIDNNFKGRETYENTITSSYRVVFGSDTSGPIPMSDSVGVKKIVVGEPFDFSLGASMWDVALIFLDTCNHEVEPIKLLQQSSESSDDLLSKVNVLGWGNDEEFCVTPYRAEDNYDPLQQMEYEVQACEKLAYCQQWSDRCDPSLSLCMTQNNVASCTGDSGGPIFVEIPAASSSPQDADTEAEAEQQSAAQVRSINDAAVETAEKKSYYVQVGVLSGGEVIQTGPSSSIRSFVQDPDSGFKDQATGAFLPSYNDWLRKHLETDACLNDSHLTLEDLFVDYASLNSQGTPN